MRFWDGSKSWVALRLQLFCKNISYTKTCTNFFMGLSSEPILLARGIQRDNIILNAISRIQQPGPRTILWLANSILSAVSILTSAVCLSLANS